MKRITVAFAASALVGLAGTAPVSAQEENAGVYVYASYFNCGGPMSSQADEAASQWAKPVYDAAVADGTITSWGWLAHHTGGNWSRVPYFSAPSLQGALDASEKLDTKLMSKDKKANAKWDKAFGEACGSHEDYIWSRVAGNDAKGRRGDVAFSTYYVCDSTREEQADALVKQAMAPVYDKMVADGKLVSWAWWEHIVGGKYRRLETFTATDLKSLIAARTSLNEAFKDDPVADAVTAICDSHADYIWNIKIQNP